MLVRDVLKRRDQLKNYLYGLKRSINYFENVLNDHEMGEDLKELHHEIEKELKDINKALATFENMEM